MERGKNTGRPRLHLRFVSSVEEHYHQIWKFAQIQNHHKMAIFIRLRLQTLDYTSPKVLRKLRESCKWSQKSSLPSYKTCRPSTQPPPYIVLVSTREWSKNACNACNAHSTLFSRRKKSGKAKNSELQNAVRSRLGKYKIMQTPNYHKNDQIVMPILRLGHLIIVERSWGSWITEILSKINVSKKWPLKMRSLKIRISTHWHLAECPLLRCCSVRWEEMCPLT